MESNPETAKYYSVVNKYNETDVTFLNQGMNGTSIKAGKSVYDRIANPGTRLNEKIIVSLSSQHTQPINIEITLPKNVGEETEKEHLLPNGSIVAVTVNLTKYAGGTHLLKYTFVTVGKY